MGLGCSLSTPSSASHLWSKLQPWLAAWLNDGLDVGSISIWAIHPSDHASWKHVLRRLDAVRLVDWQHLGRVRQYVVADVLFILDRLRRATAQRPGAPVMLAFGLACWIRVKRTDQKESN